MDRTHSFGYWLRRRKALELTQAELAQRASRSLDLIQKIEPMRGAPRARWPRSWIKFWASRLWSVHHPSRPRPARRGRFRCGTGQALTLEQLIAEAPENTDY